MDIKIDWDVFLQSKAGMKALADFAEGKKNNRELWTACRSSECRREINRMRVMSNYDSRQQAARFLRRHKS